MTEKLNEYNKERQEEEKRIFEEAINEIEKNNELNNEIIVISKEGWHHGVIGIVASKITEMYLINFKSLQLFCFLFVILLYQRF